ncbi:MAG TPA: hypothetical protein PLN48_14280 [Lachnospiraceae bacterium]|nr:hypothetical protein [Bacteroidales bacterium]HUM84909.1 hypothetical protein [Lachnospiraceae bacterium]
MQKLFKILPYFLIVIVLVLSPVFFAVVVMSPGFLKDIFAVSGGNNGGNALNLYQTVSAYLMTIPSLLLAAIAIMQTHHIHKLESRYHRPSLYLKKADITVLWIQNEVLWPEYRCKQEWRQFLELIKDKDDNYLEFHLVIGVDNGVEISEMSLERIEFRFGYKNNFIFTRNKRDAADGNYGISKFYHYFNDGKTFCILNCDLSQFLLKNPNKGQNLTFWNYIEKLSDFKRQKDFDYRQMTVLMDLKLRHDNMNIEDGNVYAKLRWSAENNLRKDIDYKDLLGSCRRRGIRSYLSTTDGFFLYGKK